jgi:hypothetical protein
VKPDDLLFLFLFVPGVLLMMISLGAILEGTEAGRRFADRVLEWIERSR